MDEKALKEFSSLGLFAFAPVGGIGGKGKKAKAEQERIRGGVLEDALERCYDEFSTSVSGVDYGKAKESAAIQGSAHEWPRLPADYDSRMQALAALKLHSTVARMEPPQVAPKIKVPKLKKDIVAEKDAAGKGKKPMTIKEKLLADKAAEEDGLAYLEEGEETNAFEERNSDGASTADGTDFTDEAL